MSDTEKLRPLDTIWPMIACWLVMVICTVAGWVSTPIVTMPNACQLVEVVIFLLFVCPVYFGWTLLYEQQNSNPYMSSEPHSISHLRQLSSFVPTFVLFGNVIWLVLFLYTNSNCISDLSGFLVRLLFAAIPFYFEMAWRSYRWPERLNRFTFRYKYLFPAFATCLVPFMYAWSVAVDSSWAIPVTVVALVVTWFLSLWCLRLVLILAGFALFGAITICAFPQLLDFNPDLSKATFAAVLGVLMTLVMGVSESWRATQGVSAGRVYIPQGLKELLPDRNERVFYFAGTNIATALFVPCFFLSFLHPSITPLSAILVSILLVSQFGLWFVWQARWSYGAWNVWGIVFGLALPIAVSIGMLPRMEALHWLPSLPEPSLLAVLGAIVLFGSIVSSVDKAIGILHPAFFRHGWLTLARPRRSLAFAGAISGILCIVMIVFHFIQTAINPSAESLRRLNTLEVVYGFATLALVVGYHLSSRWFDEGESGGVSHPSELTGSNLAKPTVEGAGGKAESHCCVCALYIFQSCRPYTSVIVWLVTATAIFFATHKPIVVCGGMSLPMLLVTMAGFLLNDVGDRVKDRLAGRSRPIAQGLVPAGQAMLVAVLLLLVAVSVDWYNGSPQSHVIILAASAGVAIYTSLTHAIPLAKGLFTCLLCLTPFLYGASVTNSGFPWTTYAILSMFIVGRELLLDSCDMLGDYAFGMKTVPHYIGPFASVVVAFTLMVVAGSVTPFVVLHTCARVLSMFGLAALILSGAYWPHDRNTSIVASRMAFLFGGIALATTVGGGL